MGTNHQTPRAKRVTEHIIVIIIINNKYEL